MLHNVTIDRKDALLEIGCEELPADYIDAVCLLAVRTNVESMLRQNLLDFTEFILEATCRRLVFRMRGLAVKQEDDRQYGPPHKAIFDPQGNLTKTGEGFLRKNRLRPEDLIFSDKDQRVEFVVPGRPVKEVLPEIFSRVFKEFQFPKTMRWEGKARFARPVRWLVAMYGGEVISFQFADIQSGRLTALHPLCENKQQGIPEVSQYDTILEAGKVLLDIGKREARIQALLEAEAAKLGGKWIADRDLLRRVTMMTEWPGVLSGRIPKEFMGIPGTIITTAMKEHQRYFAVEDKQGKLLPFFLAVHDNPRADGKAMQAGYENVLIARLKDAQFFYQEDMKQPLTELVPKLERVLWIKGLGNLLDKTRRLEALGARLAEALEPAAVNETRQAAHLAKADLITNMIQEKEYTSLQGTMGGIYALAQGQAEAVARAIGEQYLPRWAEDRRPQTAAGRMLALADKIDHIIGCWGAGFIPTGAKDAYAIRRAVQGVIAITLEAGYRYVLDEMLGHGLGLYPPFAGRAGALAREIKSFFQGRLETELANRRIGPDVSQAVLGVWWDDVTAVVQKAKAIQGLKKEAGFSECIITFSRVVNILPKETPRQVAPGEPDVAVEGSLLTQEAEKQLYQAYQELGPKIAELSLQGEFATSFTILGQLKIKIDRFFDDVLVMDKNEAVRTNRLNLLTNLARKIWSLADFSRLVLSEG
ncbi:glycine--tRNA ligase subunit beta [candidate division FCPU426 bacterium]|nr:glycine--tRNA ligase subunit beta [candidate division FCPU426 bacterium]